MPYYQPPHAPDTMCPAPQAPDKMCPAALRSWYTVTSRLTLLIQCIQPPHAPVTLPTPPWLYCPLELWGGTNLSFLKLLLSQQRDKYLIHHLSISGGRWNTSIQINSQMAGACHQNTLAVTNRMPLVPLVHRRGRVQILYTTTHLSILSRRYYFLTDSTESRLVSNSVQRMDFHLPRTEMQHHAQVMWCWI